jgi:hypothetical protein
MTSKFSKLLRALKNYFAPSRRLTPSGRIPCSQREPPAPLVRINDCRLARAVIEEGIRVAKDASASRRHRETLLMGPEAAISLRTGPKSHL